MEEGGDPLEALVVSFNGRDSNASFPCSEVTDRQSCPLDELQRRAKRSGAERRVGERETHLPRSPSSANKSGRSRLPPAPV